MEKPDIEQRKVAVNITQVREPVISLERYSSLEKLVRIMMYVIRFCSPLGARANDLIAQQRKRALAKLISQEQKTFLL